MKDSVVLSHFGHDQAAAYDERWKRFAPIREALDFLSSMVLSCLPSEARVLCVGVGTGEELIYLARAFPQWRFTAVEPSSPMIEVCRKKVAEAGILSRCDFHAGFLDSLPPGEPFDAATSILVSQFLMDQNERRDFFRQIAKRLRSGALLINADLSSSLPPSAFEDLFEVWWRTNTGTAPGSVKAADTGWGKAVSVSPPEEIEGIIESAGFDRPIQFYQALFIRGWYARTLKD